MFYMEDMKRCMHLVSCYVSANEKLLTVLLDPKVPAAIRQHVHGSWLFKGSQTLTSAYFKMCSLNYVFLLTVIIYFELLFVDVLLVLISRDVIKTSGDGVCMWRAAARQPKGRKHGGEVLAVSVLNWKAFFFSPDTDCSATETATVQVLLGTYRADGRCYQATLCRSQQAQELLEQVKDSDIILHLQYDFSKLAASKIKSLN